MAVHSQIGKRLVGVILFCKSFTGGAEVVEIRLHPPFFKFAVGVDYRGAFSAQFKSHGSQAFRRRLASTGITPDQFTALRTLLADWDHSEPHHR